MSTNIKASIVVLNYNGEMILSQCLDSIMRQTFKNLEVILVDNNSTDRSVEIAKNYPAVKLILNHSNIGFTGGNWVGIKNANSEFVAFINNDTIIDDDWIECMLYLIKSDPIIGAVGGKVLKPNGRIDSIGSLINYPSGRAQFDRGFESGELEDVVSLPGSAFMVRKDVALKIGFLDMDYFLLYDETDFFWRLRLAGYRCVYSPKALSWHMHGYTFDQESSWTYFRREFLYIRNMMWSNLKNLDDRHLIPYFLYEIAFSMKQIFKLLIPQKNNKEQQYIKAYFYAVAQTLLSIRKIRLKRKYVQSIRKVPDAILLKKHNRDKDIISRLLLRLTMLRFKCD